MVPKQDGDDDSDDEAILLHGDRKWKVFESEPLVAFQDSSDTKEKLTKKNLKKYHSFNNIKQNTLNER